MQGKFTTSANIIRDTNNEVEYLVTPNAEHVANEVGNAFRSGIHSFTLIGSYGTGKSSFLLAFLKSIEKGYPLKVDLGFKPKTVDAIRLVGQYQSIIQHFQEYFEIESDFEGNQKVFDALYQKAKETDFLVIYLDEFGKFLEFASKHNPDKELYFLQELAEFVNDHKKNILLVSTLHQSFEAYASNMVLETQKREWKKVKGRFKELTFNEPVEQLLFLASQKLKGTKSKLTDLSGLAINKHLLGMNSDILMNLGKNLGPMDVISAGILTRALQSYGQNERSLFTFLESDLDSSEWFNLPKVYDYLLTSFYSYLESSHNPHFRQWRAIMAGIDRIESSDIKNIKLSLNIFKAIALLQLFGHKGAQIDTETIAKYFKPIASIPDIGEALDGLKGRRLIVFANYNKSFKVIEGTDVDFEYVLNQAEESVDKGFDTATILNEHFSFPVIQAKEASYKYGTPRLFAFQISTYLDFGLKPTGAIDGYINLVFNNKIEDTEVQTYSKNIEEAILLGYFTNAKEIEDRIYEILKTKKVLSDIRNDSVAKQEFLNILSAHERLLSHEVMGALYTGKVRWFFKGKEQKGINNSRSLNKLLSKICLTIYPNTPIFKNELLNKHKISTSIHTARKNFFNQLYEKWNYENLDFPEDRYPPEKTIYQSLIKINGMHKMRDGYWELGIPSETNGFKAIWEESKQFLFSARNERASISKLIERLSEKPFKLKQGLIDFWVPTFLFINRGDFALYEEERFVAELNDSVLYLITRQPEKYYVKSFEITDLRLKVFNKYREVLQQEEQKSIKGENLIESLKPFLVFYKSLNTYAQNTNRLSKEALALRNAIINARDLEETFFEAIPRALNLESDVFSATDAKLSEFAVRLNDAIEELKTSYAELLNRIEDFICSEILGEKLSFIAYKDALERRYSDIKEHRLLSKQKVFLRRLSSPLNDRDSWLASIAQAILGKSLEQIKDEEEELLKDRLADLIQELDSLQELHKMKSEDGDQVLQIALTTNDGLAKMNVRISKSKMEQVNLLSEEISNLLEKHKSLSTAVLSTLIAKELRK